MSQNPQGRTSGLCRGSTNNPRAFSGDMIPERTVPASKLRNLFFGALVFIAVAVGIAALVLTPSRNGKHVGAIFPTHVFRLVQNCDRSITECVGKIGVLEKKGIKTGEDTKEYYRLLNTLQTLKADRTRYATDYNNRAADIFKIYKGIIPADFKRAGLPLGIQ